MRLLHVFICADSVKPTLGGTGWDNELASDKTWRAGQREDSIHRPRSEFARPRKPTSKAVLTNAVKEMRITTL